MSSTLLQMISFPSFLGLIVLYVYTTFSVSIHLSMDISVVSASSLGIANSAAVNTGVQLCFQDLAFNHLFLTFKKN